MTILKNKKFFTALFGLFFSLTTFGQQQADAKPEEHNTILTNPMFIILLCIVILLLFVIIGMAEVVKAGTMKQRLKEKERKQKAGSTGKIISTIILFLVATSLFGEDVVEAKPVEPGFNYWNMDEGVFYLMLCVIAFEIIFIYLLYRMGMLLLDRDEMQEKLYGHKKATTILDTKLMQSLIDAVPVEHEDAIMMDHNYDGIRELDNNLPPWWKYGFYLTIIVAVVYLFNFHVFHTGKLSIEEYNQEIKDGNDQVAAYMADHKDFVDEKTVTRLTDPASLSQGKEIFKQNCVACHGEFGEGKEGLGPNFTDDYWLHGGSINDLFRSVKYGWTDKGMKSWQQDLKPSEIQLVVSYVKSLRGTNPPNPKEKQGELYIEVGEKVLGDSTKTKSDSATISLKADSIKK